MLITKRTAGLSKRGSKFVRKTTLHTADPQTYSWVLRNSLVTFNFLSDEITGVKLASFLDNSGSKTWTNKSRTLWVLNTIKEIYKEQLGAMKFPFRTDIYPTKETFNAPSMVPSVSENGTKSFVFTWSGIKYNKKYQNLTCSVSLTASLGVSDKFVELSLTVQSDQPITPSTITGINDVIVYAVHYPKFIFKETTPEIDAPEDIIFAHGVGLGQTIGRPAHYLRSPRFTTESFQYSPDYHRIYHAGQPAGNIPTASAYKANYGSPGTLSIPCFVYGDRSAKEGFLIYARDPDGLHAKGFQWFSDDASLHLRAYDISDYQIEPYGMGGIYNQDPFSHGNITNTIGWTLRIQPFVSQTRWIDWYGYTLYKETVVAEQVSEGWIPDSFYNRGQNGQLDLASVECPIVYSAISPITGNGQGIIDGAAFWQSIVQTATNPAKTYSPQFPCYIAPITLTCAAKTGTDPNNYSHNYYTWEKWGNQPLGVSYGPTGVKSPDMFPVNDTYTHVFTGLINLGVQPISYLLHSFIISSGSEWVNEVSGMDLVLHTYNTKDRVITKADWNDFAHTIDQANFGLASDGNEGVYSACPALDITYAKHQEIVSGLAAVGAGAYHDTVGSWGHGCYASGHHYAISGVNYIATHPRGWFSHYFNTQHKRWLSGYTEAHTNVSGYISSATSGPGLGSISEFMCDANIADVPGALWYGYAEAPYVNTFVGIYGTHRYDETYRKISAWPLYTVSIYPPVWSQRCPAYTIVYGDRTALLEWAFPHVSNIFNMSGAVPGSEFSGYNSITDELDSYPQTTGHALMEMAAWTANHIGALRRLSINHQTTDYWELIRQALSGVSENHNTVFTTTAWSGHLDYVQQYIRLGNYEPDYIWHGNLQHPLDSWSVPTSNKSTFGDMYHIHSRYPTLQALTYTGIGLDKIVHNVYKKRDADSILLSLTNWYSGSETFTSTFDPATYDIVDSYEVYQLDVSTPAHGTKTLLSIKGANETYSISQTLNRYTWTALEIVPVTDISRSSLYQDLAVSSTKLRYSYLNSVLAESSLSVPYSYGTVVYQLPAERYIGYKAPMTQQITNNLPPWMEIRLNNNSNGWRLINSWGMNLEEVLTSTSYNVSDIWLITTDPKYRWQMSKCEIGTKSISENKVKRNLLFNSAFTISDSVSYSLPAGWTDFGRGGATLTNDQLATAKSIELDTNTIVGQLIDMNDDLAASMTASVYIKANTSLPDVRLVVSVETTDGPIKNYTASITSRSAEWRRLSLPITNLNSRIRRIKYVITSLSDDVVLINAPMLEYGTTLSTWTSSTNDGLPYTTFSTRFSSVNAVAIDGLRKIPLFGIASESEFSKIQIPTRIEKTQLQNYDLDEFVSANSGRKVDFNSQVYNVSWEVINGQIVERSTGPSKFDYFGSYTIQDLRFFSSTTYGSREDTVLDRTILACATRANLLYCVTKEVYNGVTKYVLKIITPRTPPDNQTYLESLVDFDLELNQIFEYSWEQLEDSIATISFSEIDPSYMVVTTTLGQKLFYKLYFDYYYFDSNNNRLYTIENYNGFKIQVI